MSTSITKMKNKLIKQLSGIREKEWAMLVDKHYPKFKQMEGKCFKCVNSYGQGKDWTLYKKVVKIEKENLYMGSNEVLSFFSGWQFEVRNDGGIYVKEIKSGFIHGLGNEITEREFNAAYNKMITLLNKISL